MDSSTRLKGINYKVCGVYSLEPPTYVDCFRLNFEISKLGYELINKNKILIIIIPRVTITYK